jgi:hypothetical protein
VPKLSRIDWGTEFKIALTRCWKHRVFGVFGVSGIGDRWTLTSPLLDRAAFWRKAVGLKDLINLWNETLQNI